MLYILLSLTLNYYFVCLSYKLEDADSRDPMKICMEGKIQQKLECRPHADVKYMMLKQDEIKKAAQVNYHKLFFIHNS